MPTGTCAPTHDGPLKATPFVIRPWRLWDGYAPALNQYLGTVPCLSLILSRSSWGRRTWQACLHTCHWWGCCIELLSFLVDLDHDHAVLDSLWVLPTEQCWEVHKMTCYKWRLSFWQAISCAVQIHVSTIPAISFVLHCGLKSYSHPVINQSPQVDFRFWDFHNNTHAHNFLWCLVPLLAWLAALDKDISQSTTFFNDILGLQLVFGELLLLKMLQRMFFFWDLHRFALTGCHTVFDSDSGRVPTV